MYNKPSNETIREILTNAKTIAVVGLSDKPERTSYQVSRAMQQAGYQIIPVNPNIKASLGQPSFRTLEEIDIPIDIINVFRRSSYLPEIARQAVKTNATVFWAQQSVYSDEASDFLEQHDFTVIMDQCIKVAHSILINK